MFQFSIMPPFKEQGCCDDGCDCKISNPKAATPCPSCGTLGEEVSNLTVYSLLKKEHKMGIDKAANDHFAICMNPSCETAYYNADHTIAHAYLKRDIHFKESATTHFVCYCLKITKEQIIQTIERKKLTGMQDIMKELVGPPPCTCEKNNPTGLCCDDHFNTIIKETLAQHA